MSASYKLIERGGIKHVVLYDEEDPVPPDATPLNDFQNYEAEKATNWPYGTEQKSERCVGHLAGDPTRLRVFLSMDELYKSGYEYLADDYADYIFAQELLEDD